MKLICRYVSRTRLLCMQWDSVHARLYTLPSSAGPRLALAKSHCGRIHGNDEQNVMHSERCDNTGCDGINLICFRDRGY